MKHLHRLFRASIALVGAACGSSGDSAASGASVVDALSTADSEDDADVADGSLPDGSDDAPSLDGFEAGDVALVCAHFTTGPTIPIVASKNVSDTPPALSVHTRAEVTLAATGAQFAGYVGLSVAAEAEVVLLLKAGVTATLLDGQGGTIGPEHTTSPGDSCAAAPDGTLLAFHLPKGSFRLYLGPTAETTTVVAFHVLATDHDHDAMPAEFASLTNPFAADRTAAAAAGKATYDLSCAKCHGAAGLGDGSSGATLMPLPADLTEEEHYTALTYLYWRITTGGETAPEDPGMGSMPGMVSQMPKYADSLTDDDRWRLVNYIAYTLVPAQHPAVGK